MPSNFTVPTDQDAIKYDAELKEVCDILQSWHPIGEVRGIGLLEAAEALRQLKEMHVKSTLAADQGGEQAIDEAWLREIGFEKSRSLIGTDALSLWTSSLLEIRCNLENDRCYVRVGTQAVAAYKTRRQLTALLTALAIDTTTTREGK